MLQKIVRILGGDPHKREVEKSSAVVDEINRLEAEYEKLSDEALRGLTDQFRQRIRDEQENGRSLQEILDEILPEAFATVREAGKRTIGLRHYDVQLIGGITLHSGKIAEMRTGEGKTLVATLPVYLNALTGRGVHLITVNDYLARRDARWMAPVYQALGLSVGVLQMAARTENGRNAFIVDLEKTSPHEDQHQLRLVLRSEAYQADITYGTNSEFGFDYLRDNLTLRLDERVQRGHYFAIVDEVDNILIDEARTPLIISGPASEDTEWYNRTSAAVRQLQPEDYEANEKDRTVTLTEVGEAHVEELLEMPLRDPERPEDVTPEQARVLGYLEQALRAQFLYRRNKDYLVQGGKVVIIDEFTGRLMPGRRWSEGLHQAVEAKEGVKVEAENVTYATITIQNYFRMYEKLSGMTGTALTEAEEFHKIYKLDVLPIPTNLEFSALQKGSIYEELSQKDGDGYKCTFYARRDDPGRSPIYWKRQDYPDVVFRTEEAKVRAIIQEIVHFYIKGRPQLVGTTSVEHSERLSDRLSAEPVRRLAQVALIRQTYLEKNKIDAVERAIPELAPFNKPLPDLEVSDLRPMARTLGISLNPEDPENLSKLVEIFNLSEEDKPRLLKALQGGVPHQVLNARKHDEESMIIARAGAFGAVTIATNMAGRGVDIKLGGELTEDMLADVIRVLSKAGLPDPYDMNNEARREALLKINSEDYGIYEESVRAFIQYLDDMKRVRALGGLHVVGSERHEARRIDNQLRGRAARQGDPGSSRFYLSLEDELMRLFGGQQADGLFKRLNIDESLPIESGLLGRMVEQSQERVEGSNFDVRKHLLEYDDVLNSQRKRIYEQRDRAFTKEDLSEDVLDMLRTELQQRIPQALKDEEGPWKLLAYLDEIQPPVDYEGITFPSYTLRLLLDEIERNMPKGVAPVSALRASLLNLASRALEMERDHVMHSTRALLDKAEEALDSQRDERFDTLDTFMESVGEVEEGEQPRRPQELVEELSNLVHLPLKLSAEQIRLLSFGDKGVGEVIRRQIEDVLVAVTLNRAIGAVEHRLEEPLNLRPNLMLGQSWGEITNQILDGVETVFAQRIDRLVGSQGQIARDLDPVLDKIQEAALSEQNQVQLMRLMMQGARMTFDRRTHRQGWRRFNRLSYVYLASNLVANRDPKEVTEDVLEHLINAQVALQRAWGLAEWNRLSLAEATLQQFEPRMQEQFGEVVPAEAFNLPLSELSSEQSTHVCEVLGKRLQNQVYRQLLLNVISEQWVDYLTQVEALRVSIGLEAYAQRDPLVQYKGRASELFQSLLADVRMGVISRMFTYQPRRSMETSVDREKTEASASAEDASESAPGEDVKKKRRRH